MEQALKLLGITWAILTFIVSVAFFAGPQWEYWKKMRVFIDTVPNAKKLNEQVNKVIPTTLACQLKTEKSIQKIAPDVEAIVPQESFAAGFRRVAGGCRLPKSAGGYPAHNGIPIESIPIENGWRCAVGDQKNVSPEMTVEAFVVYCKLQ